MKKKDNTSDTYGTIKQDLNLVLPGPSSPRECDKEKYEEIVEIFPNW